jgi:hypothetical protein
MHQGLSKLAAALKIAKMRGALKTPPDARAEFKLLYNDLLVGTLSVADGMWRSEYSNEFRKQDELRPLAEFPDVSQPYESKELWQLFVMRILPSRTTQSRRDSQARAH